MNKGSTSKTSKASARSRTDRARLNGIRDEEIDTSDIPELTVETAAGGIVRAGGKPVPRGKKRLTMYLDAALVEYFKAKAGTRGYQTLINEALKQAIERETLEETLRRVLCEESAPCTATRKR